MSVKDKVVDALQPRYVKPFVKRHKNDTADAEAIVEAALRPTMRFVDPKTPEQQGGAVLFGTRAQFIRQRTEAVNALRAHLYEFGYIAPIGIQNVKQLALIVEADSSDLPALVRFSCRELIEQISRLSERLGVLDKEIARLSGQGEVARRLRTMPGVGPITALAIETFAPVMESLGSRLKCDTDSPKGIGCCHGKTLQAPERRGTWRDFCGEPARIEPSSDRSASWEASRHHRARTETWDSAWWV